MLTLSPQGRAVAAIVLAFTLLTGSLNRIVFSVIGIFGDSFPEGRPGIVLFSIMIGIVTLAVLALARSVATTEGWAGAIAQGAVVLALVNLLLVSLSLLGGLIQGEEGFATGYFGGFYGLGGLFGGGDY